MPDSNLPDNTNSQASPAALSQLCDKCQVLSFDNGRFGVEKEGVFEPERGIVMNQRYNRKDRLPELLILRASAAAGCAFCAVLRDATIELRLGGVALLEYELEYSWGVRNGTGDLSNLGLYLLNVCIAVTPTGHDGLRPSRHTVVFSVDLEGKQ